MNRKALAIVCSAALAIGGMFLVTGANSPTKAAVSSGPFSAWATGTAEHVGALDSPPTRAIDAEAAFSRAGTASDGLGSLAPVNNELGQAVVPTDLESVGPPHPSTGPFNSYGAGSGVELGLGKNIPNNPDANQLILGGLAEQVADPPTPPGDVTNDPATNGFVTKDLININQANPLLYANALRGQGKANWSNNDGLDDPCGATQPLAFGLGHAADVQLINQGSISLPLPGSQPIIATDQTPQPPGNNPGAADESRSFTSLIPDPTNPGHFIVHSETRQILAPVTLFKGTSSEVNIDIGGEWVLKADADGHSPTQVTYAPDGAPTPTTPILRVFSGGKLQGQLTTQDILTNKGLNISIPPNPAPPVPPPPPILLEISAGEQAHPIGNTNAPIVPDPTGKSASGAVDVVRVKVLNSLPQFQLADVRVGHMEVNAQAPAGGVTCSVPAGATTTSTGPGGGATTTTTGPGGGGGTTTTTAPGTTPGNATTTTTGPGGGAGTTTTTANPGTSSNNTTTTTAATKPNNAAATPTTGPAQVQAVTFSQTPPAQAQSQTPNVTGQLVRNLGQ